MYTISNGSYISNRDWMRDALIGENVVVRGASALDFLRLFVGYVNESEIDVYAMTKGVYDNINYHVVDSFDGIEYFSDGGVQCSTFEQAVNDMLSDFENADEKALANALSNYYFANNESFDGLFIKPENILHFEQMMEWAMEYYNE
jgi:hypothetical protein